MPNFGDLKKDSGLKALNDFLADKSFLEGYTASQADVAVYEQLKSAPSSQFANALRWYNNISSYSKSFSSLPGVKPAATKAPAPADDDEDEDVDLFGSDEEEEDADAARVREERLAAYAAKKSKKPGPIAKSQVLLDCKPWDDETDMKAMETAVRSIQMEGLVWGASELKPVGFGIKKLSILSTIVDDLVSVDDLTEKIEAFDDFVQSVDIAAFNKV